MKKSLTRFLALSLVLVVAIVRCGREEAFYSNVLRSDLFEQVYIDQKYDFLWVLDNSGSMVDRTAYVRDNIATFLQILTTRKAIDFQMAITTVDYFGNGGGLVKTPGGLEVVRSISSPNPGAEFASIVNSVSDSFTSFWEQGLESAYQAVLLNGSKFMREGVPLIIIVVTDADDYSCKENCFGSEPEHNTNWTPHSLSRYVNFFKTIKSNDNSEVLLFPITALETSACGFENVGSRYLTVMQSLGGTSLAGSVCAADIKNSYENVAKIIADRGVRFPLTSKASGSGFSVYVDGQKIDFSPDNYIYEASSNSIVFTGFVPKKGAKIEIVYNQEQAG